MGPVEILFLSILLIFGAVGLVRGANRELGVTVMLLIGLLVLQLIDNLAPGARTRALALVAGANPADQLVAKALIYTVFLVLLVFISYQGSTLSFPGNSRSPVLALGAGLLNGYLFAGSAWFYLQQANWPFLQIQAPFTPLYGALLKLLPPAILDWRYLIALVIVMMILRVWK